MKESLEEHRKLGRSIGFQINAMTTLGVVLMVAIVMSVVAYMSFEGLPALVKDLVDVSSLKDDMKGDIKKTFGDAGKKGKGSKPWMEAGGLATKDGILEMDYTEHGLLLLLICAPEQIYLKRLQNLIQLEAKENYKGKVDFSLTKAYTCISSNASYKLNPMVKLDSRMTSGVTVKKKKDLSY